VSDLIITDAKLTYMKKPTFIFLTFVINLIFPIWLLSQETNENTSCKLEVLDYPRSLDQLLKKFEGKVVYIDIMASWCKPCLMELKELKKLQSYFEEKNIVKLYISIDNKEDIEKAVMMIQKDSLDGYFISYHPPKEQNTRSSFPKEIETLFMTDEHGNPSITIPTYAIVNKKGEIVEKRAERPSNSTSLKEQLEKYIE
jgi:thiol-disulfide isomerase/thioredoxin